MLSLKWVIHQKTFYDDSQGRSWVNVDDTHDWVRYKEGVSPRVKLGQNSLLEIDGGVGSSVTEFVFQ